VTLLLQTPLPPWGSEIALNAQRNEMILTVLGLILGFIVVIRVFGPITRAWVRKLEGKAAPPELQAEVDQLRDQLAEVEPLRHRVEELEERVEFAERLLAQRKDQDLLPRGGQG
jgi:flagellar biosynthesis/type III secretory pathway M-ring protein FliF/YscJ